jgi:hypothetical protein
MGAKILNLQQCCKFGGEYFFACGVICSESKCSKSGMKKYVIIRSSDTF